MPRPLTPPQARLYDHIQTIKPEDHDLLVSGHEYRTAMALERRGLATVRYQGPSLGWVRPTQSPEAEDAALRAKIDQINALIDSLPQDQVIWWLAGDGSWGGLPGLGLYLPDQVDEDMRDQYDIDEEA